MTFHNPAFEEVNAAARKNLALYLKIMEKRQMKREQRYYVFKIKDLTAEQKEILDMVEVPRRNYVVVEDDWPEYEKVWAMIEERVNGRTES